MKVDRATGMSACYTLGNYEKQVLIELDKELTIEQCQRIRVALWQEVRNLIEYSYDCMFEPIICKMEIKKLLRQDQRSYLASVHKA